MLGTSNPSEAKNILAGGLNCKRSIPAYATSVVVMFEVAGQFSKDVLVWRGALAQR